GLPLHLLLVQAGRPETVAPWGGGRARRRGRTPGLALVLPRACAWGGNPGPRRLRQGEGPAGGPHRANAAPHRLASGPVRLLRAARVGDGLPGLRAPPPRAAATRTGRHRRRR